MRIFTNHVVQYIIAGAHYSEYVLLIRSLRHGKSTDTESQYHRLGLGDSVSIWRLISFAKV
jgi:hypothetical protein